MKDDDSIFFFTPRPADHDTDVIPAEELNRLAIEQFEDAGGSDD